MTTTSGRALAAICSLLAAPLIAVPAQAAPIVTRAEAPVHTLQVSGAGVSSYPAFDPEVERYAVTTTDETAGTITVTATTSDPAGSIYVDGALDADGTATVTGLDEGDEVAVFIVDSAGTDRHSLIYLPAKFPTLAVETSSSEALTPGAVMLGLGTLDPGGPGVIRAAVDRQGVPVYVAHGGPSFFDAYDFKKQPNGSFSLFRSTTSPGRTGQAFLQLDAEFRTVSTTETVGLVHTDGHDSIALPDGTIWLIAYEVNEETGLADSIIQRIDPDGTVGFEWTSAPYVDESLSGVDADGEAVANPEYAHVNSIDLMDDGSILASFRGFSSVFKIDTRTPTGSVVWKLGGVDSTFDIVDATGAPDSGPCAQHTARELDDGSIMLFDNGAATPMCVDPADPDGERVARTRSRVLRLALDEAAGTAVVEQSYAPSRFTQFAGSAQALDDGDVLVGWGVSRGEIASQVDASSQELWRLFDANPVASQRYYSYRAHLADVPDVTDPTVRLDAPADGSVVVEGATVTPTYSCHDRGGSSLQTCDAVPIDTSTRGRTSFEVTAADGAGNITTVTRSYRVRPPQQPDAWVRTRGGSWVGRDSYGPARAQRVTTGLPPARVRPRTLLVRLQNDGATADRLRWKVVGKQRGLRVVAGRRGTTPLLEPDDHVTVRVRVLRGRAAAPGSRLLLTVPVRSVGDGSRSDAVSVRVVARGR